MSTTFGFIPPKLSITCYLDGCPSDWLTDGAPDRWHTIATVATPDIRRFESEANRIFRTAESPDWKFWKQSAKGPYRVDFFNALAASDPPKKFVMNAISFRERDVRDWAPLLAHDVGIGFETYVDQRQRRRMRHEYLSWKNGPVAEGYHCLDRPENQMLPLLAMTWWLQEFAKSLIAHFRVNAEWMAINIISDNLSGDIPGKQLAQEVLQKLARYRELQIMITNSPALPAIGDYLADNIAGALDACISGGRAEWASRIDATTSNVGWSELVCDQGRLRGRRIRSLPTLT